MEEKQMLTALCRGSEEALGWFIRQYTPYVSTIVYHVIGQAMSPADVEEVTADVFVSLWHHAGEIRCGNVKSWLGSVARNTARNRLRQLGQDVPLEDDVLLMDDRTPEAEAEQQEWQQIVRQAVLAMEKTDREIFLRHYYYCQRISVIAQEMNMNSSTVKSRLRRGREKLRLALWPQIEEKGDTTQL